MISRTPLRRAFPGAAFLATSLAFGADVLPYTLRTRAYSGYGTTVRGDNETIGMAGATVAIPNSISSIESNPAGLTMTMGNVTAQINGNEFNDRVVTGSGEKKVRSSQWGLTVTPNEWGYSIAYYSPNFEGGRYLSPNTGRESEYEVSLKQVRLSVSRLFFKKRLSLAAAIDVNHAIRDLDGQGYGATDLSYRLGAIYHWRKHILFGMSFSPRQEIGGAIAGSGQPDMPGFAQPVRSPMILNTGVGWIPNRFFSAGFAIVAVGTTRDTALLRDESIAVGNRFTYQPRLGASYVIGQYQHLKVSAAAGTYYEMSRTAGVSSRLHFTGAFQVNPYFVNLGLGVDRAERFNNFFVSVGFDIVRALRTFEIIPRDTVPPLNGFWPKPLEMQSDGLPDGLTAGEPKRYSGPSAEDVTQIIEKIPTNVENKLKGLPAEIPDGMKDKLPPEDGAKPSPKPKKRRGARSNHPQKPR